MVFAHPSAFWLLALVPLLAAVGLRGGGERRRTAAVLRAVCVGAFVAALTGPVLVRQAARDTPVVVVDVGPRVPDAAIATAARDVSTRPDAADTVLVAFSSRAEVLDGPATLVDPARRDALRRRLAAPLWPDDAPAGGANPAAALQLAGAAVPAGGRGAIVLLTDGRSDHGDAAAEAWRLAGRGIAVRTVAPDVGDVAPPAVRVRRVTLPSQARIGQTLTADIEIESTARGTATVRLTAGDGAPVVATAAVAAGTNRVALDLPITTAGLTPVRAAAWTTGGPDADSAVLAAVRVDPAADVLVVQDRPDAAAAAAFGALLGASARVTAIAPERLAARATSADAVVLADVPADRLPRAVQLTLRHAVRGGTGLLVAGAARSFGPGGYDDSALAPLLPVRMPQTAESIDPSTTLVLILDTSGSMLGPRLDLAKAIARLAMSHLKPHDKVGLVEFYGGRRWAAPIQSAANVAVIGRALDRLSASGSTTLYPAIEEAAYALRGVRTRSKHLLILSDGFVEDAPFATLARQMAADGVTISTAQVGPPNPGAANVMPDLARWGNGRFYTVPDPYGLPDVTLKEPKLSLISPVVRTSSPVTAGDDPLVRGLNADTLPPVAGYVRTEAMPNADVLLRVAGVDPLLTRWRYGAGYVAALTTQVGSTMTDALDHDPAFARVLAGLLRQLDDARGGALRVSAVVRPAGIEIDLTGTDPDASRDTAPVRVTLADANGLTLRDVTAGPVTAGHWNVLLPDVASGVYDVTAAVADLTGRAGVAVPVPAEVAPLTPDRRLLARIDGFARLAAERAALRPPAATAYFELQHALVVLGVVLLLLQVAVRRWPAGTAKT